MHDRQGTQSIRSQAVEKAMKMKIKKVKPIFSMTEKIQLLYSSGAMVEQKDATGEKTRTVGPGPGSSRLHPDSCPGPHGAEF